MAMLVKRIKLPTIFLLTCLSEKSELAAPTHAESHAEASSASTLAKG